jgi:hypothetical protein
MLVSAKVSRTMCQTLILTDRSHKRSLLASQESWCSTDASRLEERAENILRAVLSRVSFWQSEDIKPFREACGYSQDLISHSSVEL